MNSASNRLFQVLWKQLESVSKPKLPVIVRGMTVNKSVHAGNINEVHNVPFDVLIRPFPSELDEKKVASLMESLSQGKEETSTEGDIPPIDVLWLKGSEGGDYYYSFGGCHRYEAHKRLKLPSIRCKLVKSTINDLRCYLGSSTPDLK